MNKEFIELVASQAMVDVNTFSGKPVVGRYSEYEDEQTEARKALSCAVILSVFDTEHKAAIDEQIAALAKLNVGMHSSSTLSKSAFFRKEMEDAQVIGFFEHAEEIALSYMKNLTEDNSFQFSAERQAIEAKFALLKEEYTPKFKLSPLDPLPEHDAIAGAFARSNTFAPSKDPVDRAQTVA